MGRRGPKPSLDQAERGFPGRRKSKAKEAVDQAKRLARLLAPGSAQIDAPAMLHEPLYAPALAVWRKLAPELRRTHRLSGDSETMFMAFCVYAQEWAAATDDLHTNGFTQAVATVAGGKMERRRPPTFDRQIAFQNMRELSKSFGLTPDDMYGLFKGQVGFVRDNPDLFDGDGDGGGARRDEVDDQADAPASLVGSLAALRSPPPDKVN